jgi:hypothetical protein
MNGARRFGMVGAIAALAAIGVMAAPGSAHAWWRGGGVRVGVFLPPVFAPPVYAPPPVYYAPPAYYPPPYVPGRVWIRGHWNGPYWIPGHWS